MFCILALKPENHGITIFDLMTLTIKLVQDIIKVNPCTKFHDHTSNRSAVRVLTHGHTHRDRRDRLECKAQRLGRISTGMGLSQNSGYASHIQNET